MTLRDWLSARSWKQVDLRRALAAGGCTLSASTINRLVAGTRLPNLDTAAAIARVTRGAVMPNDFYGLQPAGRPVAHPPTRNEEAA